MKQIPLYKGRGKNKKIIAYTTVDDKWYDFLSRWQWKTLKAAGGKQYVARHEYDGKNIKCILMHRVILNTPKKLLSDHIDHNTFNNQEVNLRIATHSQNNANRSKARNKTSQYLGVWKTKKGNCKKQWTAQIEFHGNKFKSQYFLTEQEAALEYNNMASFLHGDFANLNKIIPASETEKQIPLF